MELVYLWVEEYKNIKNQGFNFSPRFEFHYDKDSKKLTKIRDESTTYKSIFPDNINITAIVGENGTGKSSLLKLILFLIFCKNYKKDDEYPIETLVYILRQFSNKELFLIISIDGVFKKIVFSSFIRHLKDIEFGDEITTEKMSGSSIKEEILKEIPELIQEELKFFTFYLNYMLDTLNDGYHDNWVNRIYHKQDNYKTPLLIQPDKHDTNTLNDVINLFMIDFINQRRLILLYKNIAENQKITSFFNPNYLRIKNNFIDHYRVDMTNANYTELTIIKKIANKLTILLHIKNKNYKLDNAKIPVEFKKIEDEKDYEYMNLLYIVFKILTIDKTLFNQDKYDLIENNILNEIETNKLPTKNYLKKCNFEEIIRDIAKNDYRIKKILIAIEFHKKMIYNDTNFNLLMNNKKVLISDIKNILEGLASWIDIIFYENDKSFESLSSGEKSIFRMIIDILYQIQKIKTHYKSINIMLDETELGLHPQWQKEYLKNILESIIVYVESNFSINLIFATHSPFILSDLAKENVIFLEKYKNVSKNIKLKTFGANIHTLLSNGFFMSDGLMGEFAKGKINEIKNFYEKVKKSKNPKKTYLKKYNDKKKDFKNIQRIIGEPFLETIIKNYLDELEEIFGNEAFKMKKKKEFLDQFSPKELQKYLDEKNAKA